MITIDISDLPDSKWNERVEKSGLGTLDQIDIAAQNYLASNQKPKFLRFFDNNENIVGQLIMAETQRFVSQPNKIKPTTKKLILYKILNHVPTIKKSIHRWTYGPLIFDTKHTESIFAKLGKYFLEQRSQVSGWTHPLSSFTINSLKNIFEITPWSTYLIDLSLPIDELYSNLEKHNCRKNIERAKKRGVVIEQITESNLKQYFDLYSKLHNLGGKKSNYDFILQRWKMLKPFGRTGFLALKDGKPVSGMLFSSYNGYIIEGGVARSEEDYTERLYSQDLIKWSIIEWGVKNKMRYFDLAGFNPNPTSEKEKGIEKFKRKWGGKKYDYYGIKLK
jgi:hypothetical protein